MWEAIALALIVSVIAPTILAWLTNRNRRAEKTEDWKRLDDVAARAAEAARLLAAEQKRVAEATKTASDKLDTIVTTTAVIHTLVNSSLTAAIERQLFLAKRLLETDDITADEQAALKAEIAELGTVLSDRRAQAATAQAIIEKAPAGVIAVPTPVKVVGPVTIAPTPPPEA